MTTLAFILAVTQSILAVLFAATLFTDSDAHPLFGLFLIAVNITTAVVLVLGARP